MSNDLLTSAKAVLAAAIDHPLAQADMPGALADLRAAIAAADALEAKAEPVAYRYRFGNVWSWEYQRNGLQPEEVQPLFVHHDPELPALRARVEALEQTCRYESDIAEQALQRMKVLEEALRKAINQNEHDMLMTGEEIRSARAALDGRTNE